MLKISYVVMAFIVAYIMPVQAGQFTPRSAVIQLPATLDIPGSLAVGSVIWSSGEVFTQLSGIDSEKYLNLWRCSARDHGGAGAVFAKPHQDVAALR